MEYTAEIGNVLEYIDKNIMGSLTAEELAKQASFSATHLSRIFLAATGIPIMTYVARRKLQYALHDLYNGKKVIDVAMDYGFDTHAGFTKAFKKHYGYPPSLCRLYVGIDIPEVVKLSNINNNFGGIILNPEIRKIGTLEVVGYTSRHRMPDVCGISDIPSFWDKIGLDYSAELSTLHHTYAKSKHCEIGVCFDIDEENGCFTYMLGVGVDESDSGVPQRPGTYRYQLEGGLYAVFLTPLVEEEQYVTSIHEAWKYILTEWLPTVSYRYDDNRQSFEYYDERDHSWLHGGKQRMTIYIPVVAK